MNIIHHDRKEEKIKLKLQNLEDLWHISKILEKGDLITGKTLRKTTVKRGSEISEGDKKPITMCIEVEKWDFHQYTGKLRITGKIKQGPEDIQLRSFHTMQMEPDSIITVQKKKWKSFHIDRLKKAKVKETLLFICAIDRERADFAGLKEFGIQWLGSKHFRGKSDVKQESDQERDMYYADVLAVLEQEKEYQRIVLCGPGFERENFHRYVKEKNSELAKNIILEHTSTIGKPGIQEVIRASANRILRETRIARETEFIEKLLLEIKKRGLVVHSKEDVEKSLELGAVGTLLIAEEKIKEFESLMEKTEEQGGTLVIISPEHEAGEQFLGLGGIAAFLRFRPREINI